MPVFKVSAVPDHFKKLQKEDLPGYHKGDPPRCRKSGTMERYIPTDPRVEPDACEHTQIQDISVGLGTAHCLDCGHVIIIHLGWVVDATQPPLPDADLVAKRIQHNDFWFDKIYKMDPTHPDDPVKEKEIADDLKAKKVDKLDARHAG